MTQIFIFQRHALQSNPKQAKKVGWRLWGTGELNPLPVNPVSQLQYNIFYPYSFQYVRHRQKDNTIKSSLFSVIWVWILILISGVFQIVLHLEW